MSILDDCLRTPEEALYVGDSLMKDIVMAQRAGVANAHAKYGEVLRLKEYALLQRVSHWPGRDVTREQTISVTNEVMPTHTLEQGFREVLDLPEFRQQEGAQFNMPLSDDEKVKHYIELWKQTVTVQQHFNDLEWRIRGLTLDANCRAKAIFAGSPIPRTRLIKALSLPHTTQ